jgi:hypothetical protein
MDAMFASYLGQPELADRNPARPQAAPPLPADFVFAMRETAYDALSTWLEGAGAPAEVKSLLSAITSLAYPPTADAEAVSQAANAIAALGGGFNGSSTMGKSHVKEHAQAWAASRK